MELLSACDDRKAAAQLGRFSTLLPGHHSGAWIHLTGGGGAPLEPGYGLGDVTIDGSAGTETVTFAADFGAMVTSHGGAGAGTVISGARNASLYGTGNDVLHGGGVESLYFRTGERLRISSCPAVRRICSTGR